MTRAACAAEVEPNSVPHLLNFCLFFLPLDSILPSVPSWPQLSQNRLYLRLFSPQHTSTSPPLPPKMYVFQLENIDFQIQIFLFSKSRSNLPFRSLWFFFVQTWLQLRPNFAFFTPYLDRIGPQSRFHMLPHGAT